MTDADAAAVVSNGSADLSARADFQYRWRVYVFFILVFGYGMWSLRDGFFFMPQQNELFRQMESRGEKPPRVAYTEASIAINQVLGVVLPLVSLPLFIWLMYRSRGRYRLAGGTLEVPGHPAVPLDHIRSLDKTQWERKGIAVVEYEKPAGAGTASLTLRDMVYNRQITDEIVNRIEAHLGGGAPSQS